MIGGGLEGPVVRRPEYSKPENVCMQEFKAPGSGRKYQT